MTQYSGVFTLPQQAQALTSGQWATDPYFKNTTLLLHADGIPGGAQNNTFLDSSSNAFAITRNGNTTQGTFSPYMPNGYWSNYFDGTGDYLTVANNAAFQFGSSDFTIEAWIYPTTISNNPFICARYTPTGNLREFYFEIIADGSVFLRASNDGSNYVDTQTSAGLVKINQWNHIVLSKTGSTAYIGVNGVINSGATVGTYYSASQSLYIADAGYTAAPLNGYMSNFRILKGTALYTGATYTVPTAPLTAITNTSLLTCQSNRFLDSSTNAFTVTPAGNVAVQQFQPFMRPYQYSTSVIGGSGYFDGTGDYLTTSSANSFNASSGNWTIEGWMYCTSSANNDALINGNGNVYIVWLGTTLYFGDGSVGNTIVVSNSKPLNQWFHVAAVKNGTTYTVYLNGTSIGSSTTALSNTTIPNWTIGYYSGSSGYAAGYISNLRVVQGTAVYTSNFTVPTAPLTAITDTSLLCGFTNAGIYDNSMQNNLETVGNAQVSTSVVKYGSGSMYFDGSGDYLSVPDGPGIEFGSGDFTMEAWVYTANAATRQTIIAKTNSGGNDASSAFIWQIGKSGAETTGLLNFYHSAATTYITASTALSSNTWYHIAIVRSGNTFTQYINGTANGTASISTAIRDIVEPLCVGGALYGVTLNGYIDDLRITKGVARYTANFQPPQVAFANQ